jgi:hypothetical protein
MSDDKEAQRAEAERLTADYDGPVTRRKRDQRISMVCPACRARRMVSGLMFTIACRRCGSIMKPWWVMKGKRTAVDGPGRVVNANPRNIV